MDNDIQLVSDGHGLAVMGEPKAVEKFLRDEGIWSMSRSLDLQRIKGLMGLGANVARGASEFSAVSGRWIKLTEESARLVREHGLMETDKDGVSHLMIGVPGRVKNWLQTEQKIGSLLTNPAALSGVAGVMAQAAGQQAMAEIVAYLERIDTKVDEVLGKVDDTALKDMRGARFQVKRAMTMRDHEGRVTPDAWSEVQNASGKLADVQGYAILQLEAIATKMEHSRKVRDIAAATEAVKPEIRKWLAVLADTFQLQQAFDVLALDKAMDESSEVLNARRQGLEADRADRLEFITEHAVQLLERMDTAVAKANKRLPLTREKSLLIINAGNSVAADVHEFLGLLGVEAERQAWEPRRLAPAVEFGSKAIQQTKDKGPLVVGTVTLAAGVISTNRKFGGGGQA